MYQVDTLHVCKYWSEVLCYITSTHLGDLEVKGHWSQTLIDLVAKHKSGELRCPATGLILIVTAHIYACHVGDKCSTYVRVNICHQLDNHMYQPVFEPAMSRLLSEYASHYITAAV